MTTLIDDKPVIDRSPFPEDAPAHVEFAKAAAMRSVGVVAVALNTVLGSRADRPLGILTYHRVADHVHGLPAPLHNVEPRRFREQLEGLLRRGFQFWPLSQAIEFHRSGDEVPGKTVVVTFDDGFATVFTEAWPILSDLNIPATIFVNTAYMDDNRPFPFDSWGVQHHERAPRDAWRPLTEDELSEMHASGLIEIGAHTHTHRDLRGKPEEFRRDLQQSIDIVRERFSLDEVSFAFPFGSRRLGFAGDALIAASRTTEVTCGLTTQPQLVDPATDPIGWGRFNVFSWDTSVTLAAKLGGWYAWAPALRRKLALVKSRTPAAASGATAVAEPKERTP